MNAIVKSTSITDHADFADRIPIDARHTLDQLLLQFSQVRDGLPELVKNAKDQYSRLGVTDRADRQILVLVNTSTRALGVIDFAGATRRDFELWTTWSGLEGARRTLADDIEAGHGNGGKAFMVLGATQDGYMESCTDGRLSRRGYKNDDENLKYRPAIFREGSTLLDDVPEPDYARRFQKALERFGLDLAHLPEPARRAFVKRGRYTAVCLEQVSEWARARSDGVKTRAAELVEALASHGQAALTLETCEVWIAIDGKFGSGGPIHVASLEPYPGFEKPRAWDIPDTLIDPRTSEEVDTTEGVPGPRFLRLHTSRKNLQMREDSKPRNVVRVWNDRNNVANLRLSELVAMPAVYFIYGELRCPALQGSHLSGATRTHWASTPLTRALEAWMADKVGVLAREIQRAQIAETPEKDQVKARDALREFRHLMRGFLEAGDTENDAGSGAAGRAAGQVGVGMKKKRNRSAFGSRIDRIVLEQDRGSIALAAGTRIPVLCSCIEDQPDGSSKPVLDSGLVARFDTPGVANFAEKMLSGASAGETTLTMATPDGAVESNPLRIEVVEATSVDLVAPSSVLKQGERAQFLYSFKTANGSRDDLLLECTVEEPGMGVAGRGGRFTAGGHPGVATICVKYGSLPSNRATAVVEIGEERMPPRGSGGESGSDIPDILLCGTEAPGTEDLPPERRTHQGGEDYPTIVEEPQFPNVVWLNHHSAEARRVRKSMGTPKGLGGIGNKTFAQFMAMKCFEILKRLWVRQHIRDQMITETQFLDRSAEAEVLCAGFIDAAWDASESLYKKIETE